MIDSTQFTGPVYTGFADGERGVASKLLLLLLAPIAIHASPIEASLFHPAVPATSLSPSNLTFSSLLCHLSLGIVLNLCAQNFSEPRPQLDMYI